MVLPRPFPLAQQEKCPRLPFSRASLPTLPSRRHGNGAELPWTTEVSHLLTSGR